MSQVAGSDDESADDSGAGSDEENDCGAGSREGSEAPRQGEGGANRQGLEDALRNGGVISGAAFPVPGGRRNAQHD